MECIYHGAAPLPPLSTVLVAYPAARLPIIGVFYVVLWCDQLPPVTSYWDSFVGCPCQGPIFRRKDLTACGAEAPLPPRVLRDILDKTVKVLVDCLVTFIFLATATTAVIDIAQELAGPCVTMVLSGK